MYRRHVARLVVCVALAVALALLAVVCAGTAMAAPLGDGTGTITLHVFSLDGTPAVGAQAFWDGAGYSGSGTVPFYLDGGAFNTQGTIVFSGVPAVDSGGDIGVTFTGSAGATVTCTNQSWSAAGIELTLQPGRIPVAVNRGGPRFASTAPGRLQGVSLVVSGSSTGLSTDRVAAASYSGLDPAATSIARFIRTLPGTYGTGELDFVFARNSGPAWVDEAVEIAGDFSVTAGNTVTDGIVIDEANDAQRVDLSAGPWWSGKPGTKVKLTLENFGLGWPVTVTGECEDTGSLQTLKSLSVSGRIQALTGLAVPAKAPVGYSYYLGARHNPDGVWLEVPFQVCTLKSSVAIPTRGRLFRLSGVVPIEGRDPGSTGTPQPVTLYKRTTASGQPRTLTPKTPWVAVKSVRTDGNGHYVFTGLRQRRATWYVVRYALKDDWYWPAFTSVLRVPVK